MLVYLTGYPVINTMQLQLILCKWFWNQTNLLTNCSEKKIDLLVKKKENKQKIPKWTKKLNQNIKILSAGPYFGRWLAVIMSIINKT